MNNTPNLEQQKVIDDFKNNIILFASAGTGKTFTVACKVGAILEKKLAAPQEILCLTFTIKACGEMKEDINRFNPQAKGVNVKTIHSFCLGVIEEESRRTGDGLIDPTVFDDADQEELLKNLVPDVLTRLRLSDFLKRNKVSNLSERDVSYVHPYGFFWNVERGGRHFLLNSRGQCFYKEDLKESEENTSPENIICPDCGAKQMEKGNFCGFCGYDFRTYIKPEKFRLKEFRNLISAIKRYRAIYGFYSGDDAADYQRTYDKLQSEGGRKFLSLVSVRNVADGEFVTLFSPYAGRITEEYNRVLRQSNKVDFDDLIVGALELLQDKSVYERWRNRFKFIVVDEMQDTSVLEYSVLKLLFGENRVMTCGDIFQTIYEWRGSEPVKILEDYRKNFNAVTYMFAENYRSTKTLAAASFGYLKNTYPELLGKFCPDDLNIKSEEDGEPIRCVKLYNEAEEAKFIYRYLLKHRGGSPSDYCIMSRSNGYIAKLYRRLEEYGATLPQEERLKFFTVEEDYRFYKKPVIKDVLAIWSLLLNRTDSLSFGRIACKYIKGVGTATLESLRNNSAGADITAFLEEDAYIYGDNFYTLIKEFENGNTVVYDIETTGLDLIRDEAIQIAAVKIDGNGEIIAEFNTLVVPDCEISEGALRTHGYDLNYIRTHGGVKAREALIKFGKFVEGAVLVGHNSIAFDRAVIDRQLIEQNLPALDVKAEYDTLAISKLLCPETVKYKLSTLCELFGIVNKRAHDAFADVNATAEVLAYLIKERIVPARNERSAIVKKFSNRFKPFFECYKEMSSLLSENKLSDLNGYVTDNFGLQSVYKKVEDEAALSDLKEAVLSEAGSYPDARSCMRNFLSEAALSGSQMDFLIKKLNKIPIVTVHQSKGCEFKTVILAGADSNNFPGYAAVLSGNDDEEKRIFYVAISRAKQKLVLTCYVNAVSASGAVFVRTPSSYVDNIPRQYIEFYDRSNP